MTSAEVVFPASRVVDFDESKKCLSGPSSVVLPEVALLDNGGLTDVVDLHVPFNLADGGRLSIVFSGTPEEVRDLVWRLREVTAKL